MKETFEYNAPELDRLQIPALVIGVLGLIAIIVGYFFYKSQDHLVAFQAYLIGFLFWWCVTMGTSLILMLQHMTGGRWGLAARRALESGARLMPLMLIFFLPVVFGMHTLYNWTSPDVARRVHTTTFNTLWLNPVHFLIRAAVYFLIWIVSIYLMLRWSHAQDQSDDPKFMRWIRIVAAPGLVIFAFTSGFAVIDWVMSIDPGWSSTVYGFIFLAGQGLGALALITIVLAFLSRYKPFDKIATINVFHDLGNLMMAFVILWAYMGFSQLLIQWSGNGREDANYYWHRGMSALNFTGNYAANTTGGNYVTAHNAIHYNPGGWQIYAIVLIALHFFLPLGLLVARQNKRNVRALVKIALLILVMRVADIYWNVIPMFSMRRTNFSNPLPFSINWMDVVAPIAIGGIWLFFYIGGLRRRPVVAVYDARLLEVGHGH